MKKGRMVIGYMDKTDFDYELGNAAGGNIVFGSVEDLKKNKRCAEPECGIVEVEVRFRKVILERKGK